MVNDASKKNHQPESSGKRQKDRSKPEFRQLRSVYSQTPFGMMCTRKEFFCLRCGRSEYLELPDAILAASQEEDISDDFAIDAFAKAKGWISGLVPYGDGKQGFYSVCPHCVTLDFENSRRLAAFFREETEPEACKHSQKE